jgi:hypothetical protein
MSVELTEQQAREEFRKLSLDQLRMLAISEGKPTDGMSANDLIELLLGHCPGCNKGKMTLVIISGNKKTVVKQNKNVPCKTGNCK